MKIMLSCGTLQQGGAERVISVLSKEFIEKGHDVKIILYYDRPVFYDIDERVEIVNDEQFIGKAGVVKHIKWRRSYIKKENPDVVISFLAPFNMVNVWVHKHTKIPLIVADRNDPRKIPSKKLLRIARNYLYRKADGVVVQNENNQNYFSKKIRKKSAVIFNPINLGDYEGIALNSVESKKIVCVGRLTKQKNLKMLINAFEKICEKYPEHKLVFYGDGEQREELEQIVADKGLIDRIEFAGAKQNVFEYTKDACLYVMSSDFEGMPNALLEAMCMGIPVISTKVSGATDVIEDGVNGLLVDQDNANGMANAIDKMLGDDEFRKSCGKNAVKLADELRTEKIAQEWIEFVEKIYKG